MAVAARRQPRNHLFGCWTPELRSPPFSRGGSATRHRQHDNVAATWGDFDDDLCRGAVAKDYAPSEPPHAQPPSTVGELEVLVRSLTRPPDLHAIGNILGRLVQARLEPLPERQVLSAIKSTTGISVAILEKQVGELRRRLNATGDVHRQPQRPRWANQLHLDLTGTPERNEANVVIALSNDEAFAGTLVFDEFRQENPGE
jgi:putative DNA primase/helicase